jgi:hypothetical protein
MIAISFFSRAVVSSLRGIMLMPNYNLSLLSSSTYFVLGYNLRAHLFHNSNNYEYMLVCMRSLLFLVEPTRTINGNCWLLKSTCGEARREEEILQNHASVARKIARGSRLVLGHVFGTPIKSGPFLFVNVNISEG